jgi:hypothetical protein
LKKFHAYLIQLSLKSGGTKDHIRQVKGPGTTPYWKAGGCGGGYIYIWIWILPEDVISFKCYGTNIIRIFTYLLQPSMKSDFHTDHVWEGYLRKIPVERRKISRAEWRGKFSLKTGIFCKYPSQTWYICLITPNII